MYIAGKAMLAVNKVAWTDYVLRKIYSLGFAIDSNISCQFSHCISFFIHFAT